jgi:hypothetical protein
MSNHFSDVLTNVQQAPQGQKIERALSGIAKQMQQSHDQETKQLGSDLQSVTPQIVKACQQGG